MIDLNYIIKFFNHEEQEYKVSMIREYLQYNVLNIIFKSSYGKNLSFLGGTAIRIVHNANRYSEDLDFDNFGLDKNDFEKLTKEIESGLTLLGFNVEIRNVYKGAWHCNIKLPGILFENKLSNFKDEKILIQIDTVKQEYKYKPEKKIIDKFNIYSYINSTPIDILLSKKIHALVARKRIKGRDFYDIAYLSKFTKPNYNYLNTKIGIKNSGELKEKLLDFCKDLDLEKISEDVKPFLINKDEVLRIIMFREFVEENF